MSNGREEALPPEKRTCPYCRQLVDRNGGDFAYMDGWHHKSCLDRAMGRDSASLHPHLDGAHNGRPDLCDNTCTIAELRVERDQLRADLHDWTEEYGDLQREINNFNDENQRLRNEISAITQQSFQLQQRLGCALDKIDGLP